MMLRVHKKANLLILFQLKKNKRNYFISRKSKAQSEETATCPQAYSINVRYRLVIMIAQLKGKQKAIFIKEAKKESLETPPNPKNAHNSTLRSPIVTEYSHGLSNTITQPRSRLFKINI